MRWSAGGLVVAALLAATTAFLLEGSSTSYAQFRKWNAGLNGTLELEFKTEQPNGLLLYTDDGGTYDFFELKLVEGALRLRYNLGGGAQMMTVGRDLNDNHWHKVEVRRAAERTSLSVDGQTATKASRGKEFHFGRIASNSDVYVGGMPSWYNSKLTLLALPSVIFEPRFGGAVRNLVYADDESPLPRRQEIRMKDHKCGGFHCVGPFIPRREKKATGLRGNSTDACEEHDPCQHGGICISTDSGPICECRNLDYEGIFCEKDKAPSEATFRGVEYLWYDLSRTGGEPIVSTQDSISLNFKTRHLSGLIYHTGEGSDYLNLAVRDGGVLLTMGLGNSKLEIQIKPKRVRFDDNQWHKLTVHRRVQEITAVTSFCRVSMVVDGVYTDHSTIAGTFTMLSSSRAYVGGSQNTVLLPGSKVHSNFVGCLRKVEFSADTLRLNLVELARTGNKLVAVAGRVDFMCQEVDAGDPLTFTTPASHLVLPNWDAPRTGSVSIKIRTTEPDGLILFSQGGSSPHGDLFAVEMVGGHLWAHLDLGSGAVRVKGTTRRVDDGSWHEVALKRTARQGRLTVDGSAADFTTPGESNQLDLEGGLYVGGVGGRVAPPAAVWTAHLRQGFVGCVRDLVVNGQAVDIAQHAQHQDSGSIQPGCHKQSAQCESSPCMSGGICREGWNRFVCDCTPTSFTGPTCGKEATTLSFNGTQSMRVTLPRELRSQTEEVRLRFRTTRPVGLLFMTSTDSSSDKLQLSLSSGRLRLVLRIADKEKVLLLGQGLNDNQWHLITYSRRADHVHLQVDDESPIRVEAVLGRQGIIELQNIHIGGVYQPDEEISGTNSITNFVGSMQQLTYNGEHYFELAKNVHGSNNELAGPGWSDVIQIETTANFSRRDHHLLHHPVTFRSKQTFVGLPLLKAYSSANIYFQFKTREADGLILYNGGREQDFVAVELSAGHVVYTFDMGDGPVRVRDNARASLNDNKWHSVTVGRPAPRRHTLLVDDAFASVTSSGHNEHLNLAGLLYLGGVPKDNYEVLPKLIQSKHGYEGCLASLDLNGDSPNVLTDAVISSSSVSEGCDGPSTKCSHNVCSNRGTCVQEWNSYTCDCDMTSYTGPKCTEESISYEFGPNRGLITYVFPEDRRPEMKGDVLALGFITDKEDCVLFRVDSGTSNDYMELEIVDGNIYMVYNMGTNDHPIGDIATKVNDNGYHVVRFTRNGANSSIQLDDYNVQTLYPTGHQLSVFNSQSQIQVGGKWNRAKQRVERAFAGVISGLVFNGLRLLDLAADRDPRTEVRGDVALLTTIRDRLYEPLQRMQQTPASGYPGVMDDLVFSGAGSGCNADDEDQCTPVFETGSGDDLITPVYVPPTRSPMTKNSSKPSPGGKPCDDEDCFAGSGAGGITPKEETDSTTSRQDGTTVPIMTPGTTEANQTEPGTVTNTYLPTDPEVVTIDTRTTKDGTTWPGTTRLEEHTTEDEQTTTTTTRQTTRLTTKQTTSTTTKELPPLIIMDPEPPPLDRDEPPYRERGNRFMTKATVLVISIIAGGMITIILVILFVLMLKSRSAAAYKVDETKAYSACPSQSAALLNQSPPTPPNGNVKNPPVKVKKQNVKDVKEWYV